MTRILNRLTNEPSLSKGAFGFPAVERQGDIVAAPDTYVLGTPTQFRLSAKK